MIDIVFPATRQPLVLTPVATAVQVASVVGEPLKNILSEAKRRDAIVREKYANCPYKVGDVVTPGYQAGIEKYGKEIVILGIAKNYAMLGPDEEWPESDNPMIVHAQSVSTQDVFSCTVNYLKKVIPE